MTQPSLPLDHSGLGVLSTRECFDRIAGTPVGRIAFVSNGDPLILPVNHALDGDAVVFRSNAGSKRLPPIPARPSRSRSTTTIRRGAAAGASSSAVSPKRSRTRLRSPG